MVCLCMSAMYSHKVSQPGKSGDFPCVGVKTGYCETPSTHSLESFEHSSRILFHYDGSENSEGTGWSDLFSEITTSCERLRYRVRLHLWMDR
ncbi:hypothetical protein CEXT_375851 [Caerostris extrusa]|uniref:Uncharacterized protein n=1 Tax=Caerostris extrusa TaxID=172846 RepID=A0AAV4RQ01_CAEEX|nr:hypothetical protein CEXT_375851 [Caerostris extrusa]